MVTFAAVTLAVACGSTRANVPEEPSKDHPPERTASPSSPSTPPTTRVVEETELTGTEWTLVSLRGEKPVGGTDITLEIGRRNLGAFGGCNGYGGTYEATNEGELSINGLIGTSVGCRDNQGRQEGSYIRVLDDVARFRVEDTRLELLSADGETALVYRRQAWQSSDPADLIGPTWVLSSFNGTPAPKRLTPVLSFDSETEFSSYDGCLRQTGTYEAGREDIAFLSSRLASGVVDCMKPEVLFAQSVRGLLGERATGAEYRLAEGRLEINTSAGDGFVFVSRKEAAVETGPGVGWKLEKFVEEGRTTSVLEGNEITLRFDGGTLRDRGALSGSAGCNAYAANYRFTDTFDFEGGVIPATTRKKCPADVMEQEARYLGSLADAERIGPAGGKRLEITVSDGRMLAFVGRE